MLINCDEFTFRLRRDACAAVFREKVGEPARHLLLEEVEFNNEAFLLSNKIDTPRKSVHGSSFRDYSGLVQTLPNLKYSTCQSCINNNEAHFHNIKLKHVMSLVRSKEIEAVVRERFGGPACRIFRLLLMKRNLEQKQIAEMAMIPVKDTRELLYKLLKAKYVQIQEVARTSDHAPSRTFYLWRVDLPYVEEQVGREIHHATFNVRARLMFEMSREQETLLLLGKAQHTNDFPLTMKQRDSLIRMKTVAARLECSMMRLNELGLFFNTRADE